MRDLALASVLHDWRRYLPVAVAVGVSGLMMVVQLALALGAVMLAAAPVGQSSAALWVSAPDLRSLDQPTDLSAYAASPLWLDGRIARIEPLPAPQFATLGKDREQMQFASVLGVDAAPQALALARAIPPAIRAALAEPGTVALDRADAAKLGVAPGGRITVNRQSLRVVGLLQDVRAMFGVQLITSQVTARGLSTEAAPAAFYLLALKEGASAAQVAEDLSRASAEYRVWQPDELRAATVRAWAVESGAGTLFLASSAIALVITLMVVTQTLGAAVQGSVREYAALRAYGVRFRSIQGVVLRQGAYVSVAALGLTAVSALAVLGLLKARHVSLAMPPAAALGVALALVAVVALSTLAALRRLRHADPASLLR